MGIRWTMAAMAVVSVVALAGCYETADVTVHEPGKYKGGSDPLLQQQATAREEALRKRFEVGQLDR